MAKGSSTALLAVGWSARPRLSTSELGFLPPPPRTQSPDSSALLSVYCLARTLRPVELEMDLLPSFLSPLPTLSLSFSLSLSRSFSLSLSSLSPCVSVCVWGGGCGVYGSVYVFFSPVYL
jgi:hypothetical protein